MKRTIPAVAIVSLIFFSFVLLFAQNQGSSLNINVRDYCDPTTFNAAIGPGTCVRDTTNGSITFPGFLAELGADKSVGAWRFAPDHAKVEEGATLNLQSLAGETHTFTRVKRFGGGFVAFLNTASGNLTPAPECAQMVNGNRSHSHPVRTTFSFRPEEAPALHSTTVKSPAFSAVFTPG